MGVVAYVSEPGKSAWLPPCIFHRVTGLHCPGCGNTRALHALLHGDVAASLSYNLLLIPMVVCMIALVVRPDLATKRWLCRTIAGTTLAFFLLRNLPWPPFSLLAP